MMEKESKLTSSFKQLSLGPMKGYLGSKVSVHWFRHGLRMHDNPALLESITDADVFFAIYIFDGEVAGSGTAKYNRMRFFLEAIRDLDRQLQSVGGRLYAFHGKPVPVLKELFKQWKVTKLTFEEEPEALWHERDQAVRDLCSQERVQCISRVSHTLWDPKEIFKRCGNMPPLTYEDFCRVAATIGNPPHPVPDPDFSGVQLINHANHDELYCIPTPEALGVEKECVAQRIQIYLGGETQGLELFQIRIEREKELFRKSIFASNICSVDLLEKPTSLSAYLRYGSISVRKFFWTMHEAYDEIMSKCAEAHRPPLELTGQLLWREFFYVMSHRNPLFDKMVGNPVCLQIPWYENPTDLNKWTNGMTGYPWIDAGMRQLRQEGWIHHVVRHATACFLTRGDLWLNWEAGALVFYQLLLDGDWAVNSGNWMWVSSSAFEKALQSPVLLDPVKYGLQMDPTGQYVRKYVPEVEKYPLHLLFCPWKATREEQEKYQCVIGQHYPEPCVAHEAAMERNAKHMQIIRMGMKPGVMHCAPSNVREVLTYVRLPDTFMDSILESTFMDTIF